MSGAAGGVYSTEFQSTQLEGGATPHREWLGAVPPLDRWRAVPLQCTPFKTPRGLFRAVRHLFAAHPSDRVRGFFVALPPWFADGSAAVARRAARQNVGHSSRHRLQPAPFAGIVRRAAGYRTKSVSD